MDIMFFNGLGDRRSLPLRIIPQEEKIIIDTSLLNSQHYKVRIKRKMKQFKERSYSLPNVSVL